MPFSLVQLVIYLVLDKRRACFYAPGSSFNQHRCDFAQSTPVEPKTRMNNGKSFTVNIQLPHKSGKIKARYRLKFKYINGVLVVPYHPANVVLVHVFVFFVDKIFVGFYHIQLGDGEWPALKFKVHPFKCLYIGALPAF